MARTIIRHRLAIGLGLVWIGLFVRPMIDTGALLAGNAGIVVREWPAYQATWSSPGAGEEVLPPAALDIVLMLRAAGVTGYRYSQAVAADELIRQRILEGAWPIRYDARAAVVAALADEAVDCPLMRATQAAKLVRCD